MVCLHEGGEPQVGEVTCLGGIKKNNPPLHAILTNPPSRSALSQDYWMVAKHVNKNNAGKPRVLAIKALLHSFVALAATFSAMAFYS